MKSVSTLVLLLLCSTAASSSSSISSSVLDYILQRAGRLDNIFREDLGSAKENSKRRVSAQLMDLVKTFVKSDDIQHSGDETYQSFETIYNPEVAQKAELVETHENHPMIRNPIAETSVNVIPSQKQISDF